MARKQEDGETARLEDALRQMILGNVRIAPESPSLPQTSPGIRQFSQYHGGGRGQFPPQQPHSPGIPSAGQIQSRGHGYIGQQLHSPSGPIPSHQPFATNINGHPPGHFWHGPPHHYIHNGPAFPHHDQTAVAHRGAAGIQNYQSMPPRSQNVQGASDAFARPPPQSRGRFQPRSNVRQQPTLEIFFAQCKHLDDLAEVEIPKVQMGIEEWDEKHQFCIKLERGFQQALEGLGYPGAADWLKLEPFGSFKSGFATKGSDVDIALNLVGSQSALSPDEFSELEGKMPRLLAECMLVAGIGARLLSRTLVPIIKVCERPTPDLLTVLRNDMMKSESVETRLERKRWRSLSQDEKFSKVNAQEEVIGREHTDFRWTHDTEDVSKGEEMRSEVAGAESDASAPMSAPESESIGQDNKSPSACDFEATGAYGVHSSPVPSNQSHLRDPRPYDRPWVREKATSALDYPDTGVGILADVTFSNRLAPYNTRLLECYSACDPRVQQLVLFVKSWAKRRKINSSYSGTLSSYGWAMMVLHFLINVAKPAVVPNLQLTGPRHLKDPSDPTLNEYDRLHQIGVELEGWTVQFWGDKEAILQLASSGQLTQNTEPLGVLLRNFFHYYAVQGDEVIDGGYNWTRDVISIRLPTGLQTKIAKKWTSAKNTVVNNRNVRHRYLFAIEDPFELSHNVARTVTHNGVVAIRDEFRRAWRILMAIGMHQEPMDGQIFDAIIEPDYQDSPRVRWRKTTGGQIIEPEYPDSPRVRVRKTGWWPARQS